MRNLLLITTLFTSLTAFSQTPKKIVLKKGQTITVSVTSNTDADMGMGMAMKNNTTQIKKLIIIPPAYFSKPIQFDGFVSNKSGNDYAQLNYVFNNINISYATSLTHFVTYKKKSVEIDKVTIWNPDYTYTQLAEITEATNINNY